MTLIRLQDDTPHDTKTKYFVIEPYLMDPQMGSFFIKYNNNFGYVLTEETGKEIKE